MPQPFNPLNVIAEILGEPASQMHNPANAEYQCPFINSLCIKLSHKLEGPYPVCTLHRRRVHRTPPELVCVCPKRFFEPDLINDIIKHCWPGAPPDNPQLAHEIKMAGFGNVDFVIADIDEQTGDVRNFVSVEIQAVDITGTYEPAYSAIINREPEVVTDKSYGFNWANVRKRFITQLITKGFYHHHWQSRIVAVLQSTLYDEIRKHIPFAESSLKESNILFMLYEYKLHPEGGERAIRLEFDRVVGTTHSNLMTGSIYQIIPDRKEFCERIKTNLKAGLPVD